MALMGTFKYGSTTFGEPVAAPLVGGVINDTGVEIVTGLNMDGEISTYAGGSISPDGDGNYIVNYVYGNSSHNENTDYLTNQQGEELPASLGQIGKDKFSTIAMGQLALQNTDVTMRSSIAKDAVTIPLAGARFSR